MPIKKTKFDEIKKGVIMEVEGLGPLDIAKNLTTEYIKELQAKTGFPEETLKALLEINENRGQQHNIKGIAKRMRGHLNSYLDAYSEIESLIVHPKRIRDMMHNDIWKEFKAEFQKEHVKLVAQEEAKKLVERQYTEKQENPQ